ncbi:glycosyltransferase [Clostridium felsineum]|uniref:glycosyltransferase n=1 Tax=Clostridium felsineum TaxID=36839 RepID=UPI00214D2F2D|nr:glycosyltransferase [Clostridium felsineum]MCR3757811.1 glycosyltransferase [Clostridium felsineum]
MKILYLTDQFLPQISTGTTKFIYNVVKNVKDKGVKPLIITYSFYSDEEYDKRIDDILIKKYEYKGINVIAIKLFNENINFHTELKEKRMFPLREIIEKEKVDIVHICHPRRIAGIIELLQEIKMPYVITLTDCFLICPKLFLINRKGEICSGSKMGKQCIKQCDDLKLDFNSRYIRAQEILEKAEAIVTPSIFLKETFNKEFKGMDSKVFVRNHGMEFQNIDVNNKIYNDKSEITFGFASAAHYIKGIFVLISAFNDVKGNGKVKLKIYGGGNEELLPILNKNPNVSILGEYNNEHINEIYSSIDVLICPSIWYESYSFVINEAFQRKIPVIASNIGAMAEFVKNGVNGFTFDVGDSEQLSSIVKMIGENPRILNYLKSNIDVSDRNIDSEGNFYVDLYKNIYCKKLIKEDEYTEKKYSLKHIHDKFLGQNSNKNLPFDDDNKSFYYIFDMKLHYLKNRFKEETIKYVIWGASNSGKISKKFIEDKLKNFQLIGYIDKFKKGIMENVPIYSMEEIKNLDFDYAFICTTPGREEAKQKLNELQLKVVDNYLYGYGQN